MVVKRKRGGAARKSRIFEKSFKILLLRCNAIPGALQGDVIAISLPKGLPGTKKKSARR
jgi:hypothetical protein